MTTIVAVPSDTHCGSSIGLCPPNVKIHKDVDNVGVYPPLTIPQKYLWSKWVLDWEHIKKLKKQLKAKLVTVFNGDATERQQHRTVQLVSGKTSDHESIAFDCLKIPASISDVFRMTRGTPSHVGQGAESEERLAFALEATFSTLDIAMSYVYEPTIAGTTFNIAHHSPSANSRKHLEGNTLRSIGKSIILDGIARGETPPDVWVRSHIHQTFHETVRVRTGGGSEHAMEMVTTPAYQLATEYVHKINTSGTLASIGLLYFIVDDDGNVEIKKDRIEEPDVRTKETIE